MGTRAIMFNIFSLVVLVRYQYKNNFQHFSNIKIINIAISAFIRGANIKKRFRYRSISRKFSAFFQYCDFHWSIVDQNWGFFHLPTWKPINNGYLRNTDIKCCIFESKRVIGASRAQNIMWISVLLISSENREKNVIFDEIVRNF